MADDRHARPACKRKEARRRLRCRFAEHWCQGKTLRLGLGLTCSMARMARSRRLLRVTCFRRPVLVVRSGQPASVTSNGSTILFTAQEYGG